MKKYLCITIGALLLFCLAAGCSPANSPAAPSPQEEVETERLKIVTTIFPPYDFVREIAGEQVELTMLLSPGAESHSFEPTPQDIITIQNCDVFIYVGGDSDAWVDRILDSMDTSEMTILPMLDMVDTVEEEFVEGMEGTHSHDDEEDHDHDAEEDHGHDVEYDEHVWTSPTNAAVLVQAITNTLSALDTDHQSLYQENAQSYLEQLAALDAAFREVVDTAARQTIVFGDRFPFRYLADAYGLEYYAAFPGCSTETEPSAATVAFLIDKVAEEELPVVFHIELSNEKMADTIAEPTQAKKLLLHSCHNVSRDDFQRGVTYLELMTQNVEHLREALH